MGNVTIISDADFSHMVLESQVPVLVDFYADWCGPCRMVAPVVEEIAKDYAGKISVFKVNVDVSPMTATKYQVMSIPTLFVFKNGVPHSQIVGAVPKTAIENKIKAALEG